MTSPLARYQDEIAEAFIQADPAQAEAIKLLEQTYQELMQQSHHGLWSRLKRLFLPRKSIKSVYLWGAVGAGKTHLMDIFFDALPFQEKRREHFHHFMHAIHLELAQLKDQANPLDMIANKIARQIRCLCLDEFLVAEIGDAMILAGLLRALLKNNVCIITTSNTEPENLYYNGLQRESFLPAIALIKDHFRIFHIDTKTDYRLRALEKSGVYFSPLNDSTAQAMQQCFDQIAMHAVPSSEPLDIDGRMIPVIKVIHDVVWFDFKVICNVPRSQVDYLEIAKCFNAILISNITQITEDQHNIATYFIKLVDIFYDAKVKLILSAEVPMQDIYPEGRLNDEFQRTLSRLQEMQSAEYLHAEHG